MTEGTKAPDAAVVERVARGIADRRSCVCPCSVDLKETGCTCAVYAQAALAALKPGDWIAEDVVVVRTPVHDGLDNVFTAEAFEEGLEEGSEAMRERCAEALEPFIYEPVSAMPSDNVRAAQAAIRALKVE